MRFYALAFNNGTRQWTAVISLMKNYFNEIVPYILHLIDARHEFRCHNTLSKRGLTV